MIPPRGGGVGGEGRWGLDLFCLTRVVQSGQPRHRSYCCPREDLADFWKQSHLHNARWRVASHGLRKHSQTGRLPLTMLLPGLHG